MTEPKLTAERLRELLSYDPETGIFTWIARPALCNRIGAMAGSFDTRGYLRIQIDGRGHKYHRLAWLYVNGEWPKKGLDHINGVKDDNRICNLREATDSQNAANCAARPCNTSGFKGVYLESRSKTQKWRARVQVSGKLRNFGSFTDQTTAMIAYNFAALKHYGKFARLDPEFVLAAKQWCALRNLANFAYA
jgi:hypothetical protein